MVSTPFLIYSFSIELCRNWKRLPCDPTT
jgi:hypothetical protein